MHIRELKTGDEDALRVFFEEIPALDHAFFKEDLDDPAVLRHWMDNERGVRIVAVEDDGSIVATAAVWPGVGKSGHVGDMRLMVATNHRRKGLGREMARRALGGALRRGMSKITVEVVATQQRTIDVFLELGFEAEALLRDQLCTPGGESEDIVLLSHLAQDAGSDVQLAAPEQLL